MRDRRLSWIVGAAVLAALVIQFAYFAGQINDDAYITFRYSRNLVDGVGAVFNSGEYVEGYSNFLLMLLVAAAIAVGGPGAALPAAKAIGLLSGLAALVACWALCRSWLRAGERTHTDADLLAWIAPALAATSSALAMNSTTGLETTLFAACLIGGLCLHQIALDRGRYAAAGALFAAAALTRPEGVMAAGVFMAARLIVGEWRLPQTRRWLGRDAIILTSVIGAHAAFRVAYYGEITPNTYYAKMGGFEWGVSTSTYLLEFVLFALGGVVAILAFVPSFSGTRSLRNFTLPALLVALAGMAGVARVGSDWMPGSRLLVPYLPIWTALGACGLCILATRVANWKTPGVLAAAGVLTVGLLWWQADLRDALHFYATTRAAGYINGHHAVANLLRHAARPGDTVALMDIGIISYENPQLRILDITGLTDRYIAKSPGAFLHKLYDPAYVLDRKPAYIVVALSAQRGVSALDLTTIRPWVGIETDLLDHPDFVAHYIRPRPQPATDDYLERIAAIIGCERLFEHDYPGPLHCFLAVYRYHPERADPLPTTLPTTSSPTSTAPTQPATTSIGDQKLSPLEALRRLQDGSAAFCPTCKKNHPDAFVHGPEPF